DSSNGTFVDGTRLRTQSQAKSGQTIRFGSVEARLELEPGEEQTDTAEITAIHTLDKIMRQQKRTEAHPKPAASMQLGDNPAVAEGQRTVIMTPREMPPRNKIS